MSKIDEINEFIKECQEKSLWFIDKNYKPNKLTEITTLLNTIKKHSTVKEYKKACGYEQWLLQNFKNQFAK